jgi:alkanesulfonate monooxygenase SsuD/methylene tetrahydromethanopterin reductase-like flavin-dependent oxidoreductase (luciferase family)
MVDLATPLNSRAVSHGLQERCDSTPEAFQWGLYSFGELTPNPQTSRAITAQQRLSEILIAAKLADQAGLDVFAVGEHHRSDMSISATAVVLAAIAAQTQRIRLASAVVVLSTADPVRAFEDFSTLDLLSAGRAELIVGRGAFTESFALFGCNLADNDDLFEEKLELLLKLNAAERVSWSGRFRSALHDAPVAPRPFHGQLPIWVGTGGTQNSVERAGALGLPLALANISLPPAKLAPVVELYRRSGALAGYSAQHLRLSIGTHMHVNKNSQDARRDFFPYYASYFYNHTPAQYRAQEITQSEYETRAERQGPLFVGSPQEIIDKLFYQRELFDHQRFLAQIDIGGLPLSKVARVIDLIATEIMPVIRSELPDRTSLANDCAKLGNTISQVSDA